MSLDVWEANANQDIYILIRLVVLRINVDLAIFQPYLDLEAGDNQSLKLKWQGRESNPGPLAPQAKSLTTQPPLLPFMAVEWEWSIKCEYYKLVKVTCHIVSIGYMIPAWTWTARFLFSQAYIQDTLVISRQLCKIMQGKSCHPFCLRENLLCIFMKNFFCLYEKKQSSHFKNVKLKT